MINGEDILTSLDIAIHHKDGHEIICHCPFKENHNNGDQNPSFSLNEELEVWHCWTCGGGSLKSLIEKLQPSVDAEEWIIEKTIIPSITLKDKLMSKYKPTVEVEATYPISFLNEFNVYHPYLRERGISKEVAKNMRVGYDPAHDGITIPHFFNEKLRGWQTRHLNFQNETYICNTCNPHVPIPKYTNTSNFPKKNTLYNYSNALEAAKRGEKVIVVESPLSALRLISEGYGGAVATFGSWSKEQMFSLIGCLNGVYLWPDNDKSGFSNVMRVSDFLLKFVPVKIVPVVDGEKGDPGDLKDNFDKYIENSFSPFLLRKKQRLLNLEEVMFQKFGTPERVEILPNDKVSAILRLEEKLGKNVEDFSDEEREELREQLDK